MKRHLLIQILCVSLWGCSDGTSNSSNDDQLHLQGFPKEKQTTHKAIEECHNYKVGLQGIAHRSTGPRWVYSYNGKDYEASLLDATNNGDGIYDFGEVKHIDETVTWAKCDGTDLIARHSIRKINLFDRDSKQKVLEASVYCVGNFSVGMFVLYNPCTDKEVPKN